MPYRDPADRRAYDRHRAALAAEARLRCPDCGQYRRTEETLRAHRGIAHDVREAA